MSLPVNYESLSEQDLRIHSVAIQLAMKRVEEDLYNAMHIHSVWDFEVSALAMSRLAALHLCIEREMDKRFPQPEDNATVDKENNAADAS